MVTQGGKTKSPSRANSGSNSAANSGPGLAPNPDASSKLDSYLLGAADIGTIVADPNLVGGEKFSQPRSPKWSLSSPECAGSYEPAVAAVYQGANGLTALSAQVIHTNGQDPAHRIIESVASFSSPDQASAFVAASADKWKACNGKAVTETYGTHTFDWSLRTSPARRRRSPKSEPDRTTPSSAATCCTRRGA